MDQDTKDEIEMLNSRLSTISNHLNTVHATLRSHQELLAEMRDDVNHLNDERA